MDRVSEDELSAWRYFIKSHAKIIESIEQDLAEQKRVPLTTYDVLIALFESPERKLRLGDLNKKVILSKSGLTRMLDRLEKEGLLQREKSAEDRRGAYAILTAAGESELRRAWPVYAKGIKKYFALPVSEEDRQTLRKILETLYFAQDNERSDNV
ncbi:MarR family winged helix-turn-helix transcriptional regulator [Cohnella cholangitidis]|uniref:Winged helix-turn-helix transcriptional regulator n=1 Tax=Cohnella cholangitidis TaxID=2598458 RepID=A0A7G5BZH9_9BACL|nr:MarR family winged helix-turn-helix transcriptional regulator [Cohnella cholangitidis]QMV42363.1 winged helix-turn-helix transcriptional regulator [Cohnella cholangitidis]